MKIKITSLIILTVFMIGCSVIPPQPAPMLLSNSLDYSIYSKKGFLITESNSVNFTYEPIGSVTAINLGGFLPKSKSDKKPVIKGSDDAFASIGMPAYSSTTGTFIGATQEAVLQELYNKSVKLGANAMINLKFEFVSKLVSETGYSGWSGTAMAIKK